MIIITDASNIYTALPISHPNPPHSGGNVDATKVKKKPTPKRRRTIALSIFFNVIIINCLKIWEEHQAYQIKNRDFNNLAVLNVYISSS